MSDVSVIRQIEAHMVSADAAGNDDPEVSHAHADDAVYMALMLIARYPDNPEARALIGEVAAFAERQSEQTRWYS